MQALNDRFFHVLVTLGVAAATETGCAGDSRSVEKAAGGMGQSGSGSGGSGVGGVIAGGTGGMLEGGRMGAGSGGEGGAACEHTEQMFCESYKPFALDCTCNPDGPVTEEDCGSRHIQCASYDPPMGCSCAVITGPR